MDIGRYILDAEKVELGNGAGKQPKLFDINNAVVRDNPNVEVIVNKVRKEKNVHKKIIPARYENKYRIGDVSLEEGGPKRLYSNIKKWRNSQKNNKKHERRDEGNRMSAQDVDNMFVWLLFNEMG